ncbi:MAG: Hmc operon protein 4 [candidate division Zixibacteria bacterium RBG-1]|nr:MAG: Hmc operon protein 4 [candidate division Zixibacteria bacterium RBG-1]
MHSLQDFLTLTKGQEYLLAIAAMVLFTIFWLFLDRKRKKMN